MPTNWCHFLPGFAVECVSASAPAVNSTTCDTAGHTHPHDAIFLPSGDIVVAVWQGHEPGSFGGVEYWTRLSAEEE